jgi:hypothetical protein
VVSLAFDLVMAGDKPGRDVCFDSDADAITNSDLPIRTIGTLRGS